MANSFIISSIQLGKGISSANEEAASSPTLISHRVLEIPCLVINVLSEQMLKRSSLTVKDLGAHAQTRSVGLVVGLEVGWPVGSLVGACKR